MKTLLRSCWAGQVAAVLIATLWSLPTPAAAFAVQTLDPAHSVHKRQASYLKCHGDLPQRQALYPPGTDISQYGGDLTTYCGSMPNGAGFYCSDQGFKRVARPKGQTEEDLFYLHLFSRLFQTCSLRCNCMPLDPATPDRDETRPTWINAVDDMSSVDSSPPAEQSYSGGTEATSTFQQGGTMDWAMNCPLQLPKDKLEFPNSTDPAQYQGSMTNYCASDKAGPGGFCDESGQPYFVPAETGTGRSGEGTSWLSFVNAPATGGCNSCRCVKLSTSVVGGSAALTLTQSGLQSNLSALIADLSWTKNHPPNSSVVDTTPHPPPQSPSYTIGRPLRRPARQCPVGRTCKRQIDCPNCANCFLQGTVSAARDQVTTGLCGATPLRGRGLAESDEYACPCEDGSWKRLCCEKERLQEEGA